MEHHKKFDYVFMKENERNIYTIIQEKSNYLFDKYDLMRIIPNKDNKSNMEKIVRQKFYELNLNICNQVVYDYTYNFTKEDIEFIEEFNLYDAIKEIIQIKFLQQLFLRTFYKR